MAEEIPTPQFFSVPEVANLCGMTRNTAFNWVRNGKLKAYQTPGRTNLIRPSDLVAFMESSGMFVPAELANLAREDAALKPTDGAEFQPCDAQPKILVVDDDPAVRNVIMRALRALAPLYEAETGYQALHLLTLHKDIRVVFLDLRMPGLHGAKVLSAIALSHPDVKVAIVTGTAGDIPPELLKDGTISVLIRKPFEILELQKVASGLLDQVCETRGNP